MSEVGPRRMSELRKPEEAGIRSNVHNRPALFRGHRPHRLAGMKESAGKINGQNAVPFFQRKIQDAGVLDRCGIVYEDVELSESFECQCHYLLGRILARDIANKWQDA